MRILVVEDEPEINRQICSSLEDQGYVVDPTDNGRDALHYGLTNTYDAIVLDLGLPLIDGISVLKSWRADGMTAPVIILTARDNWGEKVIGIDAGADDYLTKPFHMEELLARLRALIRRAAGKPNPVLTCGSIELLVRSGKVLVNDISINLTSHEFRLLSYLLHHPGELISRTELIEHIYAQDFDRDSNTIEVFIGRLRKKLPTGCIETVRGAGYRLVCPD